MGSGISLNKNQIISIIQREIDNEYNNTIKNICQYTDEGYYIYETFDHETDYYLKLKLLQKEYIEISSK
jgi:hypothetical protein